MRIQVVKRGFVTSVTKEEEFDYAIFDDGTVEQVPAKFKIGYMEGAMVSLVRDLNSGSVITVDLEEEESPRLGLRA